MITFILTACNRPDLLEQTISSFLSQNTFSIKRFIAHADGLEPEVVKVLERFCFEVIGTHERVGLAASFDRLMAEVKTEYVFTCEDDWLFQGNPSFIRDSHILMARIAAIHHVWIRDCCDHRHPLADVPLIYNYYGWKVPYVDVLKNYGPQKWGGFSLNPGLRRTADYHRFFPNGMAAIGDEAACSAHVEAQGYQAVSLVNSACKHIGWHRHTENFKH
jgi:hypothetical protein